MGRDGGTTRLIRGVLLLAAAYLVALLWVAVRVQVRIAIDGVGSMEPPGTLQLRAGGRSIPLVPASGVAWNALVLESLGGADVRVVDVRTVHNGIVALSSLARGGWALEREGGPLVARSSGARVAWTAHTSDLRLTLGAGPAAGRVRVEWNGVAREVDLRRTAEGIQELRLPSSRRLLLARISPWTRRLHARLPAAAGAVTVALVFGNDVLLERRLPVGTAEERIDVPRTVPASVVAAVLAHALALYGRTLVLWAVFSLVGLVVLAPALPRLTALERLGFPAMVGCALVVVATTTSVYVTGAKVGLALTLVIVATVGVLLHRRRAPATARLVLDALRTTRRWRVPAASAALFGTILFFPALLEGDWYLGHHFVDVYHYTNFGEAFIHRPYHAVADHVWFSRFSDCVSLSVGALLLGQDTRAVYGLVGFFVWTTLPFAAGALLRRLCDVNAAERFGAVLAGGSASLHALFTQSYWAHYLFVVALAWSLALACACVQLHGEGARAARWSLWTAVGAVFAFAISDYSFHFLVPAGWLVAVLLVRDRRAARVAEAAAVGVVTALLVNVNASVILLFPAMRRYYGDFKQVDAIARWVVFPFADSPEFAAIAVGVRDFVRNSQWLAEFVTETLSLDPGAWGPRLAGLQAAYVAGGGALAALAIGVALLGLLVCFLRPTPARLVLGCTTVGFLLYFAYLVVAHELYGRAKLVMTIAGVLMPLLALGAATLWEARRQRLARALVAPFVIAFVAWNLVTSTLESADSLVNRKSELLHRVRSHLTVLDVELKALARFLGERDEPFQVAPSCVLVDRAGSDGDRVLVARLDHLGLVGARGRTLGAESAWEVRLLGAPDACARPVDRPPVMETPIFHVYAPRDDGLGAAPWDPTPTARRW